MDLSTLKKPSALLPIGMSLAALAVVGVHIVLYGTARAADEGTAAHLWQILMAGQLPIMLFFAFKWLPRSPKPALLVVSLQILAALAAAAPVYIFSL
ncbi:MAG: hypothetical protein PHX83_11550 [Acidobacteriia bacterium]|nr:hypothetical protein [Terriglobia bacterium]